MNLKSLTDGIRAFTITVPEKKAPVSTRSPREKLPELFKRS